jgi:hypothetical protein
LEPQNAVVFELGKIICQRLSQMPSSLKKQAKLILQTSGFG